MFVLRTFSWFLRSLFAVFVMGLAAAQNAAPKPPAPGTVQASPSAPRKAIAFDDFVDSAIKQERRLTDLLRNFKPVVETYIQEEKPDPDLGTAPKDDDYFLGRLDLTGNAPANLAFEDQESLKQRAEKTLFKLSLIHI